MIEKNEYKSIDDAILFAKNIPNTVYMENAFNSPSMLPKVTGYNADGNVIWYIYSSFSASFRKCYYVKINNEIN